MLSHTDVHLLVGLLSQITNPENVEIELGSKVLDATAEELRDVDITVSARLPDGTLAAYAGREVKDEGRPLDVTTVEQLCMKLKDMPTITHRSIVSSSGYTKPARRKAKAHSVELLELRKWRSDGKLTMPHLHPRFETRFKTQEMRWQTLPEFNFYTNEQTDPSECPPDAVAILPDGREKDLRLFAERVIDFELGNMIRSHRFRDSSDGALHPVSLKISFAEAISVRAGNRIFGFNGATIKGIVVARVKEEPLDLRVLVNERGEAHVACMVGAGPNGDLFGAAFTREDLGTHMVRIPISARNLEKIVKLELPPRGEAIPIPPQ
jgi:hypothetical protein